MIFGSLFGGGREEAKSAVAVVRDVTIGRMVRLDALAWRRLAGGTFTLDRDTLEITAQGLIKLDDGAPAILTEYMLAGLPVLANAGLVCGRQYIRPDTGLAATEADFPAALAHLIERAPHYAPRPVVQQNWTWPHSVRRLSALIDQAHETKRRGA